VIFFSSRCAGYQVKYYEHHEPRERRSITVAKLTGTRSWPVRANALLLVLQAAGLGGIGAYSVYQVDWQEVQQQVDTYATLSQGLTEAVEQAVIVVLILGVPAILALLAAFGLLLLFRMGWLLAMIVQSLTLLACLLLYAEWQEILYEEPVFIYPVMLYCIVMVLYLNSSDVRAAFQVRRRGEAGRVARGL
jgi:hypothetical protein